MKKIDKFIIKAFIGPFFAILFIVIFILMLQFLWLYIDELVGKGLGLSVILEFMMWGACTILPLALPLATLLASMMTFGAMGENTELTALKAAGVPTTRIMVPVLIASLFISVGAFFAGNSLVPLAYNEIFTLREDIGNTKAEIKIPRGTFYDGIEDYILRINDRNDKTGMMYGVMVYDHRQNKGNNVITLADSALMAIGNNKNYLNFKLFSGANYQEDNKKSYNDTILELKKIEFNKQELIIPLKNYAFKKSEKARYGDQVKSMNIKQLSHTDDSLSKYKNKEHLKHIKQILSNTTITKHNQLDSAHSAILAHSYTNKEFNKWSDTQSKLRAYKRAKSRVESMEMTVERLELDVYECDFILRRTSLEILKKFAEALACFILFFIGAPLGVLIRRGGLGTSAIVSALFFVLYWVIDISGVKLAKDGAISPWNGAFISAYILLPIGLFLTWRAMNENKVLISYKFKDKLRKLKLRIMSSFKKTRIVYMGTPEFAIAPLDRLIAEGHNIVGVVTVADKVSGRGMKVNESAVKKYAVSKGIPVLQPIKLKDPEFLKQLSDLKADIFVVVAFRMLPEEVWQMPKLGTFNLHAALLPQYRGAAPINWAIINGEHMSGVTTFMIDKDIDTGGIILRQTCKISDTDTAGDLHDALMPIGSDLVCQTVDAIIEKKVETRVQRSFIQGAEVLKSAPKLTKDLCHIDWNDYSKSIYNLIRGLSPYPAAFTEIYKDEQDPKQLKIFTTEIIDKEKFKALKQEHNITGAGQILSDNKSYLAITTKDSALLIKELQLSGKKRMDVKAFLSGFRDISSYLTSKGSSLAEIKKAHNK